MATTAQLIEAMKYNYGSTRLERLMNKSHSTWNLFKKTMHPFGGRGQWIVPILHQLSEGIVGIDEGGSLPSNLNPNTAEAVFALQEMAGVYTVTWKGISDARSNKFAFERFVELHDKSFRLAWAQDLNNAILDDGRGRLAVLPAADNTSAVTVSRPIRARQGMVVDIMDTDNTTKHLDSGTISAVDTVANTITVSGTITGTAASDYFVREDTTDGAAGEARHLHGIIGIVDNDDPAAVVGDYGGIDRGTAGNEFWESVVLSNGGTNRTITEDLIIQGSLDSRLKGGGSVDALITNPSIYRRYYDLFLNDRYIVQTNGESGGMSGSLGPKGLQSIGDDGKTQLSLSGIHLYMDDFAVANTIVGVDRSTFSIGHGQNKFPQPVSDTFSRANFFRDTTNATFDVAWWGAWQLICDNPAANFKLEDIAES